MHAATPPTVSSAHEPAAAAAEPELVISRDGTVLSLTLNRPRVLNALSHQMVREIRAVVRATAAATAVDAEAPQVLLIEGAGERAFCGGGDVKELAAGAPAEQSEFFSDEYLMDAEVAESPLHVVSVLRGVTMGGGIGLGGHVRTRIVTESSQLAMPEVRIGIVPDVGGSLLLARAPGRLGELLAMTAGVFTAGDAIALGFADHFVPESNLRALRVALTAGQPVAVAIAECEEPPPPSALMHSRSWWDRLADDALGSAESVCAAPATAALRLVTAMEQSPHREARDAAMVARQMSPVSVAVAIAQLSRIRANGCGLREVLADDHRLMVRLLARPDFAEGVRAQLIDRDGAPQWHPGHLESVTDATVCALIDPRLRAGEVAWVGSPTARD